MNVKIKNATRIVTKVWVGKQKGLMQVLWERGWIDTNNISAYKLFAYDDEGELITEYSLRTLMSSCLDYAYEQTQMEYIANQMGTRVICTTKYHAEMAGEGIEFSWGVAKSRFRKIKMSTKMNGGKDVFLKNVRACISRSSLTTINVRRFSTRARGYMTLYYAMGLKERENGILSDELVNDDKDEFVSFNSDSVNYLKIEQMVKSFRCHQNIVDLETGYINRIIGTQENPIQIEV